MASLSGRVTGAPAASDGALWSEWDPSAPDASTGPAMTPGVEYPDPGLANPDQGLYSAYGAGNWDSTARLAPPEPMCWPGEGADVDDSALVSQRLAALSAAPDSAAPEPPGPFRMLEGKRGHERQSAEEPGVGSLDPQCLRGSCRGRGSRGSAGECVARAKRTLGTLSQ